MAQRERERDGSSAFGITKMVSGAGCSLGVEQFDDRTRQARELTERSNYLFRFGRSRFTERYARNELELVVRPPFGEEAKYGFLIYPKRSYSYRNEINPFSPTNRQASGQYIHIDEPAVLPNDVEVMEGEQRLVPSLIRFQRFDDHALGRGQPVYEFTSLVASASEDCLAVNDGEISVFRLTYAVAIGEGGSENIEAASDRIDVCTKLDIERAREKRFFDSYYDIVSRWRWRIFNTNINVESEPGFNPFSERFQLGFGPINASLSV